MDTQVKPQRKAVPTRAIVWALEQGAEGALSESRVPELTKAVDRYIMAMARFNLACSARFNDVQHTSPQTVKSTSNTLELLAWQTKTTSAVAIKRNPVPLIAPLFSFSGARWWIPLEKWWKRFRASEEFREMDYLIPTINKDRTGFIPRPGTPDRSLRWLKDALGKQGAPAKDVAELSWYSFRVFMPDCAFQAHIPRDQRQYLGNCKPAITKVAADEVPPPRGPLTVIATTARKGPTKAYSMHLLDADGVTVGCGWRPGPLKISELAEQDFHAEPEMYLGCTRCFRHFTFPNTWMAVEPYAAQDSEASISLSSDTDESVDTQSDKEGDLVTEGNEVAQESFQPPGPQVLLQRSLGCRQLGFDLPWFPVPPLVGHCQDIRGLNRPGKDPLLAVPDGLFHFQWRIGMRLSGSCRTKQKLLQGLSRELQIRLFSGCGWEPSILARIKL